MQIDDAAIRNALKALTTRQKIAVIRCEADGNGAHIWAIHPLVKLGLMALVCVPQLGGAKAYRLTELGLAVRARLNADLQIASAKDPVFTTRADLMQWQSDLVGRIAIACALAASDADGHADIIAQSASQQLTRVLAAHQHISG